MISQALDFIRSATNETYCVLIGLGCYSLIPFALSLERNAALNAIASAIKGLKK